MTDAICHFIPEARETIERGWDPAYDHTRDYFKAEFAIGEIIQRLDDDFS